MKLVARWLLNILLALIVVIALVLFLAPRVAGWTFLVVLSRSMEPSVAMGSLVAVLPVDAKTVQVGDVITFRPSDPAQAGNAITHRVVDIRQAGLWPRFQTKGDAADNPDVEWVSASQLVGKVSLSLPYVGYAVNYVRTPLGFVLVLAVPAAVLIIVEVWGFFSGAGKRDQDEPEQTLPAQQA
jgi:signal peptidase